MKKIIALLAVISFSFSAGFKPKKIIPPGTVQITETFFADQCEVSNLSWLEYEFFMAQKYGYHSKEHLMALPDTTVWRHPEWYNEPYVSYYYRHKAYRDYPVVGISHEQAVAFCRWRTQMVKTFYRQRYKKDIHLEYKLPTAEEWEFLADAGLNALMHKGLNDKGKPTVNCYRPNDTVNVTGNADVAMPVVSYNKNSFGLYNTFGNVAEMLSEEGLSKGGSWRHKISELRSGNTITYAKPQAWLGFRCVCHFTNTTFH